MVRDRYSEIRRECGLSTEIESLIDEVLGGADKNTSVDYIVSRGEYFCAVLMAEYLGFRFVDAADWLSFDYDGKVDNIASAQKLRDLKDVYGKIVTPGFYGAFPNGDIHVFPRGGSDITGAIAAASLEANIADASFIISITTLMSTIF
jgi:aspartate kinase